VQDQQDACREVERMPELSEVTPDMSPADVRRLIVQRGGTIPAEEALVTMTYCSPIICSFTYARRMVLRVTYCTRFRDVQQPLAACIVVLCRKA
jgi:hypothetical protein